MERAPRYTHKTGAFFAPDGSPVDLANIPDNAQISFVKPDGETVYLSAVYVQKPQLLREMAEHSVYSEPHPDDAAVRQHYREQYAYVTNLVGDQP